MTTIYWINTRESCMVEGNRWSESGDSHRCHIALLREDDGAYSAIVLNLPGTGSCGATEDEAIANAKDAVRVMIESYAKDREEIPWEVTTAADVPENSKSLWVMVNA